MTVCTFLSVVGRITSERCIALHYWFHKFGCASWLSRVSTISTRLNNCLSHHVRMRHVTASLIVLLSPTAMTLSSSRTTSIVAIRYSLQQIHQEHTTGPVSIEDWLTNTGFAYANLIKFYVMQLSMNVEWQTPAYSHEWAIRRRPSASVVAAAHSKWRMAHILFLLS